MERNNKPSKSNVAVIESLQSLQDFASKYRERINIKSDEEKKKEESFVKEYLKNNQTTSIQDQIAETLRLAKIKEEQKRKVEIARKEYKIELEKIQKARIDFYDLELEELINYEKTVAQYVEEEMRMEILEKETKLIIEKEEWKRQEKEKHLALCRQQEAERLRQDEEVRLAAERKMKERILRELQSIRQMESDSAAKIKKTEEGRTICGQKDNLVEKQIEDEKRNQLTTIKLVQEEAKKMTFTAAMKDFLKQKVTKKRTEPREIPVEVNENQDDIEVKEEDNHQRLRMIIEDDKKKAEEIMIKRRQEEELYCALRREAEARQEEFYLEMKKQDQQNKVQSLQCDLEHKKENLRKIDFESPVNRSLLLPLLAKFEQLTRLSEQEKVLSEKITRNQKKKRNFKKKSKQILNKIISNIQHSQDLTGREIKPELNQQDVMKNYLLSQVLFDKEENLKSVNKTPADERLNSATNIELEQRNFAAYKEDMEKYLQFVGTEDEQTTRGRQEKKTFAKPLQTCHVKEMKEKLTDEKVQNKSSIVPQKLCDSQLLFTNQSKSHGKNNPVARIMDKKIFEETRKKFNEEVGAQNLSLIQEKKNEIVSQIKQKLDDIDGNMDFDTGSNERICDDKQKYFTVDESNVEMEDYVPKWIQVFLDRNSVKEKKEGIEDSKMSISEKENKISTFTDNENQDDKIDDTFDLNVYEEITDGQDQVNSDLQSDSNEGQIVEREEMKWKEAAADLNTTTAPSSPGNTLGTDPNTEFGNNLNGFLLSSSVSEHVQSYLDLIDDVPGKRETRKKLTLNKISQIDRNCVENLFIDSNAEKPKPMMKVHKLSKSLNFLNDHSKCEESSRKHKKRETLVKTNDYVNKVCLHDAIQDDYEVMKNKVKKKLFEDPWKKVEKETPFEKIGI